MRIVATADQQAKAAGKELDWKTPEHFALGQKLIEDARPTPELRERLNDQLALLHDVRGHTKGDIDAFDALDQSFLSALGLNVPKMHTASVIRTKVGDTGKTLGQLYAEAFGQAHPAMQQSLQQQVEKLIADRWAPQLATNVRAAFGADVLDELMTALPPDRQTIDLLAPALYPQHRELWRQMSLDAETARQNAIEAYGDKIPTPEEYAKKKLAKFGAQKSPFLGPPPTEIVPGVDEPAPSDEQISRDFLMLLVNKEAAQAADKALAEHPVASGAGQMMGTLSQFVGVGKLMNAGLSVGAKALPRVLARAGLPESARRTAVLLQKGLGRFEGTASKLVTETLASQAALRGTQELVETEDSQKVTLTDALFSSALMGGISKGGEMLVRALVGRRIAGALGTLLRKDGAPLATDAVAARLAKLEALPQRLRGLVELGALETITHAMAGTPEGEEAGLEKSPWWELFGRALGLAGFGAFHGIGRTSTKVPWWGAEGRSLGAIEARARARVADAQLTLRARQALRKAAIEAKPEMRPENVPLAIRPEPPMRAVLDEVFGKDAMDTYFSRMREQTRVAARMESKLRMEPEELERIRGEQKKAEEVVAERAAPKEPAAKAEVPKTQEKPSVPALGAEWSRTLAEARKTSQAKISDREAKTFETVTRAIVTYASSRMKRPELDVWEGLGTFEGHPKRPEGVPKRAKAAFDAARRVTLLFKTADISSLAHEQGHALKTLLPKRDVTAIREAVGLAPGQKWSREHEEKFAEQYEAFLATGKSPTPDAGAAFGELSGYLQAVRRAPGLEVHPRIAALFDQAPSAVVAPKEAKRAPETVTAPEPSEGGAAPRSPQETLPAPETKVYGFVGKAHREAVEAAHVVAERAARGLPGKNPAGRFLRQAAEAETFAEAVVNLREARTAAPAAVRSTVVDLLEALPKPQRISRNPEAVKAVQHLAFGPGEVKSEAGGGTAAAIQAMADHGLQTFTTKPDGSLEIVTKDGQRFFTHSIGGHDPLLYQMGKADKEEAMLNWLEASVASADSGKKAAKDLLTRLLSPFGDWGRGIVKAIDRGFRLESDALARAFGEKHRKAYEALMGDLLPLFDRINKLKPEETADAYRALHEGTPLPENHPGRPMVDELATKFFDLAVLFVKHGLLPPEVLNKPYAPHEYSLKERMGVIQEMLRTFQTDPRKTMGAPFVERLKAALLGKAISTNFKRRTILTLEEYQKRGGEVSLQAAIPTLLRESRAAHFLQQAEDVVQNFPEFWRDLPAAGEESHFTHVKGKQWGPLENKYVRNDILGDIKGWRQEQHEMLRLWDVLLSNAKGQVTGKNPPVIVGSGLGNVIFNRLMLPWKDSGPLYSFAWKEWLKQGRDGAKYIAPETVKELIAADLIRMEDFVSHPMRDKLMRADAIKDWQVAREYFKEGALDDGIARMLSAGIKLSEWAFTYGMHPVGLGPSQAPVALLQSAFMMTDRVALMAAYHGLRTGKNVFGVKVPKKTALAMVEFYNLRNLPPALRGVLGRRGLMPFVAFPYKLMTQSFMQARYRAPLLVPGHPMFPEDPKKRAALVAGEMAWHMAKWGGLLTSLGLMSAKMNGMSWEEYKRQREIAAFGEKGVDAWFLIGLGKDEDGNMTFLDARNIFPWIAFTNIFKAPGSRDRADGPMKYILAWFARKNMITERLYEAVDGHDYFGYSTPKGWGSLWHGLATPYLPLAFRNAYRVLTRDNEGGVLKPRELLANLVGLKIRHSSHERDLLNRYRERIRRGEVPFFEVPHVPKTDPEVRMDVLRYQRMQRARRRRQAE